MQTVTDPGAAESKFVGRTQSVKPVHPFGWTTQKPLQTHPKLNPIL